MNLECLKDIITNNLAIYIDLTDVKSWIDWNTGLTAFSLTKWNGAVSDNINLIDFGLTAFDNGRTNIMWSGITLTPSDTLFSMYRVGYNVVHNPISGQTSGVTVTTIFLPMTGVTTGGTTIITGGTGHTGTTTTGGTGAYFNCNGGYLQGFFKLQSYNYELLSARYNYGITIETILKLNPNSQGIFYMMGARAEDKYNPYFSGETMTGITSGATTGVTTSLNNFLDAIQEKQVLKKNFRLPEEDTYPTYSEKSPVTNIGNNVIAFEITQDKRLAYKYVDANGLIITNASPTVITATGLTLITIVFTPNNTIDDPALIDCAAQRLGKMIFYVNGRANWIIHDFPEFYFHSFNNDKEKTLGVPYSISWGGGSFGLEHSWHYDYRTYILYSGQNTNYINTKFFVEADPISTECYTAPTGSTYLAGLSLSADSTTFKYADKCNPEIQHPLTVIRIKYTGTTGTTGTSKYFIKFNQPITTLSNRNYVADLQIYNNNFFTGGTNNKISILMFSDTTDVDIIKESEYVFPLTQEYILSLLPQYGGLHPWGDGEEYEYSLRGKNGGIIYYGVSGIPVTPANSEIVGYGNGMYYPIDDSLLLITGEGWLPINSTFKTKDDSGKNNVSLGILIETDGMFNTGGTLYVSDFKYTAADILVQDERKNGLTIEQNFNSGFIGGIQKLRVYDIAFTSPEVLHNALMESKKNSNIVVSKGGRIIYR